MRLIIFNKDEFGKRVEKVAKAEGKYSEIYYLDDENEDNDILSPRADYFLYIDDDTYFFPAYEDNERRLSWLHRLMETGANLANIISPEAKILEGARLIAGELIFENAVIGKNAVLKTGCIVEKNAEVSEGCILEESVRVCEGAKISDLNKIPPKMLIKAGRIVESGEYSLLAKIESETWEARHSGT